MRAIHETGGSYQTNGLAPLRTTDTGESKPSQNPSSLRINAGKAYDIMRAGVDAPTERVSRTRINSAFETASGPTPAPPTASLNREVGQAETDTKIHKDNPLSGTADCSLAANQESSDRVDTQKGIHSGIRSASARRPTREIPSAEVPTKLDPPESNPQIRVIKSSTGEKITVVYAHDLTEARRLVDALERGSTGDSTNGQKQADVTPRDTEKAEQKVDGKTEATSQQRQRVVGIFPGGDEVPDGMRERYNGALGGKTGRMAVGTEMHVRAAENHVYPEGTITGFELPSGKVADGVHMMPPEADGADEPVEYELFEYKSVDDTRGPRQADEYREELQRETGRRVQAYVVTYSTRHKTT